MVPSSPEPSGKKKGLGRLFGRGSLEDTPQPELIVPDLGLRDPETGLPNLNELTVVLRREIARSARYGDNSALAVFDLQVAAYTPTARYPVPPSPAKFIAAMLLDAAREGDVVARLSGNRFAVLLSECSAPGATNFVNRARTKLSTPPYTRTPEGKPLFVRSWAGFACWSKELTTPEAYIEAATGRLVGSYAGYERARSFFSAA
jgi:diguanylate cyclase (GGDEF)-like protein